MRGSRRQKDVCMPKHWVRIIFSENPHTVDPCDAYKAIFQAVNEAHGCLDEMLFDDDGVHQYLLITTLKTEGFAGVADSLRVHKPEHLHCSLSALGELPSKGSSSAA